MVKKASEYLANAGKVWQEFEVRDEQIQMLDSVEKALEQQDHLLVEAGTGVGKSMAYLIPAVLYALRNGKTVVISTETKALQNQLLEKDIPLVRKLLGREVVAEVAFGAANYVCKRKLDQVVQAGSFGIEMQEYLSDFYEWERNTETGIRYEYKGFASQDFWSKITREADNCLGRKCPNFSTSYYFLEKEKWKKAHILIVNHYLLCSHIAGEFKILPEFSQIILDEAHNFPSIVGRAFRMDVGLDDVKKLLQFLTSKDKKRPGVIEKLYSESIKEKLHKLATQAAEATEGYFAALTAALPLTFNALRVTEKLSLDEGKAEDALADLVLALASALKNYDKESENLDEKEIALELEMCTSRLEAFGKALHQFRVKEDKNLVFWVEPPSVQAKNQFYHISGQPMNPEEIIKNELFPKMESLIFTSATLSSGKNDFSFFKNNIGNVAIGELTLDSPFDYQKNSLVYLPKNIREPSVDNDGFHEDISKLIPMLLQLTEGSAFVLFTSNKSLKSVYETIGEKSQYPIFSQLHLGAEKARESFLQTENSVLFGVSTFWQGIDVKGDKLKSVILTKIPFQPPGEPVLEAKMAVLKEEQANPFRELQLPHAILTFKQGFGRLIRSKTDIGVVSILDPRIKTKFYGKQVLASLPPAKIVYSFKELKKEYANLPKY
ncbi:MAG: helicase C-terminal domain-containing protein [Spirochaetota bacterium]